MNKEKNLAFIESETVSIINIYYLLIENNRKSNKVLNNEMFDLITFCKLFGSI